MTVLVFLGSKKSDKEAKAVQLKKLLEFFINSEVHNHGAYLVDSLWNTAPLIKVSQRCLNISSFLCFKGFLWFSIESQVA